MPAKRSAAKAPTAAPAQKRAKMDPSCKGVIEALTLTDLPLDVKSMLQTAVPKAFELVKEERHYSQSAMVEMIGTALEGVVAKYIEDLSAISKQVEANDQQRQALTAEQEKKEAAEAEAAEASNAAKLVLKETLEALVDAKASLLESREAQSTGDRDINKAKEDKAALEAVMSDSLTAIVEGSVDDLADHFEKLTPFLEAMTLEDSLRGSLPTSCLKKADSRRTFDTMVIQQARTCFEELLTSLRSKLDDGEPGMQERAALVAAKESETLEAERNVEEATKKLAEAEARCQEAASNSSTAKAAMQECMAKHDELQQALEGKTAEFEHFKSYNVTCFETLKEKTAVKTVEEVEAQPTAQVAVNMENKAADIEAEMAPLHADIATVECTAVAQEATTTTTTASKTETETKITAAAVAQEATVSKTVAEVQSTSTNMMVETAVSGGA
mmetsp:Transcript_81312/g.169986  ORF Transcript_81312/g.169986 Transcript_81312/m.169986 type:complete len:444 (+) Transcript_81312:141-1472(+)|eukprot:CAMPEP_0206449660 /NCGR_PEP_ID=MMETSP0324_2-20121206/18230_1 /ASSEMBLY_ACC=CAM_ASM_000836 /TAXON_ID=2866 /ORGANISM="Crypthecodinium cohnii, Strain Seligo" /LENGTH=443 /DNA_ID=CAMNT_0053919097 /DNA_START=140 /DNA_END=1471 /DNA_ORIENTATION=+